MIAINRTRIPVDPKLPKNFDSTPNDERPASHRRWFGRPYIETYTLERLYATRSPTDDERRRWLAAWPGGTRYDVRCLDGGAWDRSTWWGSFPTLEQALACAKAGATWANAR